MDWIELALKILVAIAAVAGAIAALFKWLTARKIRSAVNQTNSRDDSINKGASINARGNVNIINKSFNRTVGGGDGG
jgi:hypothetical protein